MKNYSQEELEERPLSSSSLKAFKVSPRHFIHYRETPHEDKDAYTMGKAVECLILEPERYEKKFEVYAPFDKRSNEAKDRWKNLILSAQESRKTLIDTSENQRAKDVAGIALQNEELQELLAGRRHTQKKLEWRERQTNIPMIGYVDFDTNIATGLTCCEMKTTTNAELGKFTRDAINFGYHIQLGTYALGYHKTAFEFPNFVWIAIETTAPYGCNIIQVPKKEIEIMKSEVLGLLTAFRLCMDKGKFDEDYRFWNFEVKKYKTFFLPKYAQSSIVSFEED